MPHHQGSKEVPSQCSADSKVDFETFELPPDTGSNYKPFYTLTTLVSNMIEEDARVPPGITSISENYRPKGNYQEIQNQQARNIIANLVSDPEKSFIYTDIDSSPDTSSISFTPKSEVSVISSIASRTYEERISRIGNHKPRAYIGQVKKGEREKGEVTEMYSLASLEYLKKYGLE